MIGVFLVVLVAIVIFGGVRVDYRASREKLVPVHRSNRATRAGCVVIIGMNIAVRFWPGASWLIVEPARSARRRRSAAPLGSGIMRALLQYGCASAACSPTSPASAPPRIVASAAATTQNPARQALVSMTGTFWDTVVICAAHGYRARLHDACPSRHRRGYRRQ